METVSKPGTGTANGALNALGVPGVVGIALLAFCAAFHWGTNVEAQQELARLTELRAQLEAARPGSDRLTAPTPGKDLENFYASLPEATQVGRAAEQVYRIGLRHGLTLRQGTYRFVPEKGTRLARYEATYLAQTEYYRMRFTVRDLLKEMPNLSLDDVSMQRQQPAAAGGELMLRVSLYVRGE